MQSIADSFSGPSSWVVLGDSEVADALCVGSDCKTVVIAWSSNVAPTANGFDTLMQRAGWVDVEVNDCQEGRM